MPANKFEEKVSIAIEETEQSKQKEIVNLKEESHDSHANKMRRKP